VQPVTCTAWPYFSGTTTRRPVHGRVRLSHPRRWPGLLHFVHDIAFGKMIHLVYRRSSGAAAAAFVGAQHDISSGWAKSISHLSVTSRARTLVQHDSAVVSPVFFAIIEVHLVRSRLTLQKMVLQGEGDTRPLTRKEQNTSSSPGMSSNRLHLGRRQSTVAFARNLTSRSSFVSCLPSDHPCSARKGRSAITIRTGDEIPTKKS
jgi:hypothetical protein